MKGTHLSVVRRKNWTRRFGLVLLILPWATLILAGRATGEPVRVAMPSKSMSFLPYYIGDRFGLYRVEGLEPTFVLMRLEAGVQGIVNGTVDYSSAAGGAMLAAANGAPIKATMFIVDKPIFFMMAKPEVKRIEDLKGGSVATATLTGTDAYAARAMAAAHGINPDRDLTFIATGETANAMAALKAGTVRGALLSIPWNYKAEEMGFHSLGGTADYVSIPFIGLVAADAKLKFGLDQVKRMIRATLKAMAYMRNPASQRDVIGFLREDFRLDQRTADLSYREIIRALTEDGTVSDAAMKNQLDLIRTQGKINGEIPAAQVLDYGPLKEALTEMKR